MSLDSCPLQAPAFKPFPQNKVYRTEIRLPAVASKHVFSSDLAVICSKTAHFSNQINQSK
jgi:hypothetical protein